MIVIKSPLFVITALYVLIQLEDTQQISRAEIPAEEESLAEHLSMT